MLTFENVLEIFADYLREDTDLEIVLTKRGYNEQCKVASMPCVRK